MIVPTATALGNEKARISKAERGHDSRQGRQKNLATAFMMEVNGQYATYRNATRRTTGRVWQNRFYSCVLDELPLGNRSPLRRLGGLSLL